MMEQQLIETLIKQNKTISCAESCTGGLLTGTLVNVSGASSVLFESIVTYSNEAKMKYLNVSEETLQVHGAVSEACALEMANGIKAQANSAVGVSVTGIAGPSGGTTEKPVGLVYIAVATDEKSSVFKHIFPGDRLKIRTASVEAAIKHTLEELL